MLNLIKLCVGIDSVQQLKEYREKLRAGKKQQKRIYDVHRTRMMPRKRDEIIGKGSLYWVINGKIQCRQLIIDLQSQIDSEGKKCCDIILDPKLIRTEIHAKRAFQGWRYLLPEEAPKDLDLSMKEDNHELIAQLSDLGLI